MKMVDPALFKMPEPLPCKYCGHVPELSAQDLVDRQGFVRSSVIKIQCSNPNCSKEHRHFAPRATRREAILKWNTRNG